MNEMMIVNLISVFSLFILYLSIFFSQRMSKANMFYGVLIRKEDQDAKELKDIDKNFKLQVTAVFAIGVIADIILTCGIKIISPFNLVWIIGFSIIAYYILYLVAYKKAKSFKASNESGATEENRKGKKIIDTVFMKEKRKLRKVFFYLYALLGLVVSGIIIYTAVSYKDLPQRIPTHWNFKGEVDAWGEKSFYQVFFPGIMNLFMFFLMAFISLNTFSLRIKLDPLDIEGSKKKAIRFLKGISVSIYLLTCSVVLLLGMISVATVHTNMSSYITGLSMFLLFLSLILLFYYYYKYGSTNFSKEKEEESYEPEDEDKYWIAGFIYNNPDDPLVIVEKRYGLGWTINIGTTKGKHIMLFLVIFILIVTISPFVFL